MVIGAPAAFRRRNSGIVFISGARPRDQDPREYLAFNVMEEFLARSPGKALMSGELVHDNKRSNINLY